MEIVVTYTTLSADLSVLPVLSIMLVQSSIASGHFTLLVRSTSHIAAKLKIN